MTTFFYLGINALLFAQWKNIAGPDGGSVLEIQQNENYLFTTVLNHFFEYEHWNIRTYAIYRSADAGIMCLE
ncbi:MAG: hypothetical protein RLZZ292_1223 [Bacteroidota bacterium]